MLRKRDYISGLCLDQALSKRSDHPAALILACAPDLPRGLSVYYREGRQDGLSLRLAVTPHRFANRVLGSGRRSIPRDPFHASEYGFNAVLILHSCLGSLGPSRFVPSSCVFPRSFRRAPPRLSAVGVITPYGRRAARTTAAREPLSSELMAAIA